MTTIFSKIIDREIPSNFVYEDDVCVVIMDKFPAIEGQTVVIPKMEVDYAYDLPDDVYSHIFAVAKKIAKASDKAFGAERTCLVVEGFEVPHVHIKLYPMKAARPALGEIMPQVAEKDDETLMTEAEKIKENLE